MAQSQSALQTAADGFGAQITIPTVDQVLGPTAGDASDQDFVKPTDLALIQGGNVRVRYMTQSVSPDGMVIGIDPFGNEKTLYPWMTEGVRILLPAAEVKRLNISSRGRGKNITWGEYPQTVLQDERLIKKLDFFKQKQTLKQTGKVYTFWQEGHPFTRVVPEYVFNGEKYTLLPTECIQACRPCFENDDLPISVTGPVWFKVEPIKWLRDRAGNLISQRPLFSFPMNNTRNYDGHFRATRLARYLRDCVAIEVLPTEVARRGRTDRDNLQSEVTKKIMGKSRLKARLYFAKLRGEAQVLAAHILAKGTPNRNRTAEKLKRLRWLGLDQKTQAAAEVREKQFALKTYEKRARDEEAEGQYLLKKHMAKAAKLRRQGREDLQDARKKEVKAVKIAIRAQAQLNAYCRKRWPDRANRIREE